MQTAREQLAASHRHMTADEIAANALELADAVQMLCGSLDEAYNTLRAADLCAQGFSNSARELHMTIQRVQSLFASRRKAEARELLASVAELPFQGIPIRDQGALAALTAPAVDHLFNPKG